MIPFRKNLIDGEWVGDAGSRNINPSNLDDVVGEYASGDAEQARAGHRRGESGISGVVSIGLAGTPCGAEEGIGRDHRAQR